MKKIYFTKYAYKQKLRISEIEKYFRKKYKNFSSIFCKRIIAFAIDLHTQSCQKLYKSAKM